MTTQRDAFLDGLYEIAKDDRRVILLSADLGAPSLDKFREDLPGQFINMGVAEQNTINVARGLAMAGKKVYVYMILSFYLRCYEQIRHLCMQNLNVNMVGVGAGFAYDFSGPTHHALEDIAAMRALPNLAIYNVSDTTMAKWMTNIGYLDSGPSYIRLDRTNYQLYKEGADFLVGCNHLRHGGDLTIIATGYMVQCIPKIAAKLYDKGIDAEIIDFYRLKPICPMLQDLASWKPIVTLEENFLDGGIGSIIAETLAFENKKPPLRRIGIPDEYHFSYAGREELHRLSNLNVDSIVKEILEWLKYIRESG